MSATGLLSTPQPLDGRVRFVPYAVDVWCPVMESAALPESGSASTELLGRPLVVFRDGAVVRAFDDRCPHRGVALSLGEVRGGGIRCAYHGWQLDPEGRVRAAPGVSLEGEPPRTRAYPAREAVGLVWIFLGEPDRAAQVPLPTGDFGKGLGAELVLSMEIAAHWSFVMDNGLDLFHQHLHRDVPFFFEVQKLEHFGPEGEVFTARYRATLRDALNRRREGPIAIRFEANSLGLDFAGLPWIRGIPTPRSVNGRRVTMWWLVTFPAGALKSLALKAWMPRMRAQMLRGFEQDARVLASENAAFERDPSAPQLEVNPIVPAAHAHLVKVIAARADRLFGEARGVAEEINAGVLAAAAGRGEVGVLAKDSGLLHPREVAARDGMLRFGRYEHFRYLA